jgi:glycerol-3-phosphate cytidylyltransferase
MNDLNVRFDYLNKVDPELLRMIRSTGRAVIWTNGCFDILHAGHVAYLLDIKIRHPHSYLFVGVNSDEAVRALKGPGRPVQPLKHRAFIVNALKPVDRVALIGHTALEALGNIRPDIYVKGGDYTLDTINQDERLLVESWGGTIEIFPSRAPDLSTSRIVEKTRGSV